MQWGWVSCNTVGGGVAVRFLGKISVMKVTVKVTGV